MPSADKEYNNVRVMTDTRVVAAAESTATLERHVSMSCSGTGNLNVYTRCVLTGGEVEASSIRTGISTVPMTLLSYKNEVGRVLVPPIWSARCLGSQMMRWSMHIAGPGWCGCLKVKDSAFSHLQKEGLDISVLRRGVCPATIQVPS